MKLITVEEHYSSNTIGDTIRERLQDSNSPLLRAVNPPKARDGGFDPVNEIGDIRIAFMDKRGIDMQIISYAHVLPGILDPSISIELCQTVNNEMYEKASKYPDRFRCFAHLPLGDSKAAAAELERCVKELGFVGVMVQGTYQGHFLDEKRFLPIFEKCAELDIPMYFHPGAVNDNVYNAYYKGDWSDNVTRTFSGYGLGWHYEVGVHIVRLILAGVLDRLPNLKIIIGHWGELMPYYFDRMDMGLNQFVTGLKHPISYYFKNNIYTNPSGMFFKDDMDFCLKTFGADHILWGQDFCYLNNEFVNTDNVKSFLEEYDIDKETKEKIAHGNAEKLFKI